MLLHAAGFLLENGVGVACPGISGAGKSTLTRLLTEAAAPVLRLSDDRLVVTVEPDGPWIWGTPWAGEMQIAAPNDGPLGALVFLSHGTAPAFRVLAPRESARRLLEMLSLPLWNGGRFGDVLGLLDRLAVLVPAFEYSYPARPESATWLVERLTREIDGA